MHRYLLPHAVTICVCFLPASDTIPRKVNSMVSSPYLNCKAESPAQPNEDWKRQNVLWSLNCGLGLKDISFSREHLIFSVGLKSLSSIIFHQEMGLNINVLTILIINVLKDYPKIPSGLYNYPYHTLQKVTWHMPYKSVLRGDSSFCHQQR